MPGIEVAAPAPSPGPVCLGPRPPLLPALPALVPVLVLPALSSGLLWCEGPACPCAELGSGALGPADSFTKLLVFYVLFLLFAVCLGLGLPC